MFGCMGSSVSGAPHEAKKAAVLIPGTQTPSDTRRNSISQERGS